MSNKAIDPATGWEYEGGGVWVPPLASSADATPKTAGPSGSLCCDAIVSCFAENRDKYARALKLLKHQKKGVEDAIARAEAKLEAAEEMIEAAKAANAK